MARIALWELKEASSGNAPTSAADSDPSPVNLTIAVGSGGSAWTTDAQGNGYNFNGTLTVTLFDSGALSGTKIARLLASATVATWIFKAQVVDRTTPTCNIVAIFAPGATNSSFEVFANGQIWFGNQFAGTLTDAHFDGNMHVYAIAIDTSQAVQAARVTAWIDGVVATVDTSTASLAQNRTIDASDSLAVSNVNFGNETGQNEPTNLVLKEVALYSTALSTGEVLAISNAMTTNDDVDPSATVKLAWVV